VIAPYDHRGEKTAGKSLDVVYQALTCLLVAWPQLARERLATAIARWGSRALSVVMVVADEGVRSGSGCTGAVRGVDGFWLSSYILWEGAGTRSFVAQIRNWQRASPDSAAVQRTAASMDLALGIAPAILIAERHVATANRP